MTPVSGKGRAFCGLPGGMVRQASQETRSVKKPATPLPGASFYEWGLDAARVRISAGQRLGFSGWPGYAPRQHQELAW